MDDTELLLPASNLSQLATEIVAAYVANNAVPASNLPDLIATVHGGIAGLSKPEAAPVLLVPATDPKRSVHSVYIVCLEDGKRFKSLKRHLMSHYGLTPNEYRKKWSLPRDYPMVAPNYAVARSALAKKSGVGRKPSPPKNSRPTAKTKAAANSRLSK
jgi:predicted transcriptional regulator